MFFIQALPTLVSAFPSFSYQNLPRITHLHPHTAAPHQRGWRGTGRTSPGASAGGTGSSGSPRLSKPGAPHPRREGKAPLLLHTRSRPSLRLPGRRLWRAEPREVCFLAGNALCIWHLGESAEKAERGWQWVAIKYIAAIIIITVEKAGTRISLREAEEKKYKQNTSNT